MPASALDPVLHLQSLSPPEKHDLLTFLRNSTTSGGRAPLDEGQHMQEMFALAALAAAPRPGTAGN